MSCPKGGFPTVRFNELRYALAGKMSDVCCEVHTELTFQSLNGEVVPKQTITRDDEARLDISFVFYRNSFSNTFDVCVLILLQSHKWHPVAHHIIENKNKIIIF